MAQSSVELLKGTLDVLILKTLSWGPAHGYAVSRWIRETTEGTLQVEEGALYPALHRLERKMWLTSEWGLSENNRKAKFYHLTDAGRRQLQAEEHNWARLAEAVRRVLHPAGRPAWATGI